MTLAMPRKEVSTRLQGWDFAGSDACLSCSILSHLRALATISHKSSWAGRHPRMSRIWVTSANRAGGSPARRGPGRIIRSRPETCCAVSSTCRTACGSDLLTISPQFQASKTWRFACPSRVLRLLVFGLFSITKSDCIARNLSLSPSKRNGRLLLVCFSW